MKESAIRPDELMVESDRLHALDLAKLLIRRAEFVEVWCPACGGAESTPRWEKDGFHYRTCSACESAFLSPRPPPALLDAYYQTAENYVFWSEKIFPASEAARRESIMQPRVQQILAACERAKLTPSVLVEIGAGHGTFCQVARDSGRFGRVIALEPTPSNAAACRARGVEVIEQPVEKAALSGAFADVVVSFEVIEHLYAPAAFASDCLRILKPGGLLILSCPNLKGFEVAALGTASRTVDPEHLNYFHPRSLEQLLTKTGFEVLELTTPGKLDAEIVRKRALDGHVQLDPFLHTLLLERFEASGAAFQRFLVDHQLSSHMWAIARRP
jgi:2-polyprenyl-3-methyl-5-hydroxy-6-metoxy-1,4-benzoquinol methylase